MFWLFLKTTNRTRTHSSLYIPIIRKSYCAYERLDAMLRLYSCYPSKMMNLPMISGRLILRGLCKSHYLPPSPCWLNVSGLQGRTWAYLSIRTQGEAGSKRHFSLGGESRWRSPHEALDVHTLILAHCEINSKLWYLFWVNIWILKT